MYRIYIDYATGQHTLDEKCETDRGWEWNRTAIEGVYDYMTAVMLCDILNRELERE